MKHRPANEGDAVMGWKELVRKIAGKIAGVNKLQEQIDGLHYVLNACVDIRKFPKATGAVRELQECDILLLKIFDTVCRKHGLNYWLDFGTLLGAVRHEGFIPWDDDLDVAMPRADFNRARTVLCEHLQRYGLQAEEDIPLVRIGIGYKHKETGIWLDVFSADECSADPRDPAQRQALAENARKYKKYYKKNGRKKSQDILLKQKMKMIPALTRREKTVSMIFCPEMEERLYAWNLGTIFPLQEVAFENGSFYAPAKLHEYLVEEYGTNYMDFPKYGWLHHGDASGSLVDWARNSGTDMGVIKKELEDIYARCLEECGQ